MKLTGLVAMTMLVLLSLISTFPLLITAQTRVEERSANMEDHMAFTSKLAEQGEKLNTLERQHEAMARLPERMARMEERIDGLVRMVYAILGGVFTLLVKEAWNALRVVQRRRSPTGMSEA